MFEFKLINQLFISMSEVEETLNRMQTHKNVQGIVIVNNEGAIIRSTYTNERKEEGTTNNT
jgi:dynein light chain roadblock-type